MKFENFQIPYFQDIHLITRPILKVLLTSDFKGNQWHLDKVQVYFIYAKLCQTTGGSNELIKVTLFSFLKKLSLFELLFRIAFSLSLSF